MIRGITSSIDVTGPAPLETAPAPLEMRPRVGLSLFWRTFFLLALLLFGSIVAWLQTFRALEYEPRAVQTAQQIASLVNLSRAALMHSDAIARVSLIKTLADSEGVRILPREPVDRWVGFGPGELDGRVMEELTHRLGPGSLIASQVNNEPGLWIGFRMENDQYWMLLDRSRLTQVGGRTWLIWLVTAAGLSLAGAALIARLINRPLKQLSFAASRVRDGDFDASRLDEKVATSEIREVNIGFNRMAQQLAKIEQDRAVMLAGISHDLRTPLARLRLETEMSVADADAREHMAADIDQLDAIIDKFLDYARPDHVELRPVLLNDVIEACLYAVQDQGDIKINLDLSKGLYVLADEVELARVVSNLVENARRYGKTPESGVATVDIAAKARGEWVMLKVRDHGMGVAPEALPNLVKPFFRGDAARTAATGAGLGLAIVDKTVQRMGGIFALANTTSGGLAAHIKLQRAPAPAPQGHSPQDLPAAARVAV
ncbi:MULTISPECIES: sensor histidine kinase [Ramlibacter]|uniref:histidine kinase n=1 Tax=Ramlibacter aquaticus TaxID=2780094 RepID=A0ABR9SEJ0_9BURK|nr:MULTISPECIES: sensor histidine kinase [Ramlibacter]MBE7940477.1 HAMP domain-containing protein [Ramlibacter aquaticus]